MAHFYDVEKYNKDFGNKDFKKEVEKLTELLNQQRAIIVDKILKSGDLASIRKITDG